MSPQTLQETPVRAEFHVDGVLDGLGIDPAAFPAMQFEHIVHSADNIETHGRTTATRETLSELESFDAIESVSVVDETDSDHTVEMQWRRLPVVPPVSTAGGTIQRLIFEKQGLFLVAELPPDVAVEPLTQRLDSVSAAIDVQLRHHVSMAGESSDSIETLLCDRLTERQRQTLRVAYDSGYFAWPRETSAHELADEIDISGPLINEHLRTAQRAICRAMFED